MNVFKEFKRLVSELQKQAVRYALIGGVAMAFMLSRGLQGILTSSLIPKIL